MIDSYEFGKYVIDGELYNYDIKIINNQVRLWQDRKGHTVTVENIRDLVEAAPKPEVIIIGTGASGLVEVGDDVKNFVKDKGIQLVIEKTAQACKTYNKLVRKKKVVAIFHGTC